MPTDPKLESFLARLDKALSQISISERAEIVTEIKSHVIDAREKEPAQSLGSVLDALGEPESVANRYLMERGLKPGKASKGPIVKWLTIGFLGTFAIAATLVLVILWKFSPIIKVDDENDHVSILGGMIDVNNGTGGSVHVGWTGSDTESRVVRGRKQIEKGSAGSVKVSFKDGKLSVLPSTDSVLSWECGVSGKSSPSEVTEEKNSLVLNFEKTSGTKCEIRVPSDLQVDVNGLNGKLVLEKPRGETNVSLMNGKVSIVPDSRLKYRFTTNVTHGKIDAFESSTDKDAIAVHISMENGRISRD